MQEFDFSIENLKGIDNRVADALSRHPIPPEPQSICSLRVSGYSPQEIALWQQGDASIKEQVLRLQELAPAKAKTPADNHFRLCKGQGVECCRTIFYSYCRKWRGRESRT